VKAPQIPCKSGSWLMLAAFIVLSPGHAKESEPSIFALPDKSRRMAALAPELANADAKGCKQWLERIDALPRCAARDDDRLAAVEFWAASEPKAAIAYVESFDTNVRRKLELKEAAARGWARSDPAAALAWSEQQPFRHELDLARTVYETLSETAPEKGMQWLCRAAKAGPNAATPGEDSFHSEQVFSFFRRLTEIGDYSACRRLVEDYPAGEMKNQLLFFAADQMSSFSPAETGTWAKARSGQPDAFYPLAAVTAFQARKDIAASLDWLMTIKDHALRAKLVRVAAGEAADRAPSLALMEKILAGLKVASDRHAAYAAFAASQDLVRLAPRKIMDGVSEIEPGLERRAALVRGYAHWHESDAESALRHLRASPNITSSERSAVENYLGVKGTTP
jgi:hypothetical protein